MSLNAKVRATRGAFELDAVVKVEARTTLAILGPNGSGKTTLLHALASLLPGESVATDGASSIGVVFQDLRLFPTMSALENAAFPLRARSVRKDEARERAAALLTRLGLAPDRFGARPGGLSGGEEQRVALARALIVDPDLLLLDEPTSSLDISARGQVRSLLSGVLREREGVCILVTHDPVEAMTLGDTIMVLEGGRVTQTGTPAQIRETPRSAYAADLAGVNLFVGTLAPLEDGAGTLVTSAGELTAAWPTGMPHAPLEDAVAVLRPADITLHTSAPEGGSARNIVPGRVRSISVDGERARIGIDARPALVAEITLGSVERLGLLVGLEVWASAKAVEVRIEHG
ncbi:MAG: ABC transporter ATP-binding protein [Actinomycetota bacterium]